MVRIGGGRVATPALPRDLGGRGGLRLRVASTALAAARRVLAGARWSAQLPRVFFQEILKPGVFGTRDWALRGWGALGRMQVKDENPPSGGLLPLALGATAVFAAALDPSLAHLFGFSIPIAVVTNRRKRTSSQIRTWLPLFSREHNPLLWNKLPYLPQLFEALKEKIFTSPDFADGRTSDFGVDDVTTSYLTNYTERLAAAFYKMDRKGEHTFPKTLCYETFVRVLNESQGGSPLETLRLIEHFLDEMNSPTLHMERWITIGPEQRANWMTRIARQPEQIKQLKMDAIKLRLYLREGGQVDSQSKELLAINNNAWEVCRRAATDETGNLSLEKILRVEDFLNETMLTAKRIPDWLQLTGLQRADFLKIMHRIELDLRQNPKSSNDQRREISNQVLDLLLQGEMDKILQLMRLPQKEA